MQRRDFLAFLACSAALTVLRVPALAASKGVGEWDKQDAEWKKLLTSEQFHILRREGTERPYSSALLDEKRQGVFACVACQQPLFKSDWKYDSGTGWPSFYDAIPGSLGTKTDHLLGYARTEYHCSRCGGHHGHIFNDGPQPTGLRYCSNGAVLTFKG
jgi:peptide-methionine (R)-S-oxide reductase